MGEDGDKGDDKGEPEEVTLIEEAGIENDEEESSKDEKKDPTKKKDNPYMVFLDAVAGEEDEEVDRQGLMGGLKSWLGFAEALSGTTSTAPLATDQQKQP